MAERRLDPARYYEDAIQQDWGISPWELAERAGVPKEMIILRKTKLPPKSIAQISGDTFAANFGRQAPRAVSTKGVDGKTYEGIPIDVSDTEWEKQSPENKDRLLSHEILHLIETLKGYGWSSSEAPHFQSNQGEIRIPAKSTKDSLAPANLQTELPSYTKKEINQYKQLLKDTLRNKSEEEALKELRRLR
jgi:hypothetical protein